MFKFNLSGESSIIVYFDKKIDPALPQKIAFFSKIIKAELSEFIIDLIPSYVSILVSYNLDLITYQDFYNKLNKVLSKTKYSPDQIDNKLINIPVYYDFDVGLDLKDLLKNKNLTIEEFIKIHSSREYLVYAIGFAPNFAFLGKVDKRIQSPRIATPRLKIPKGSVGIADNQTAVYPTNSSAGWNVIGRSPIDLSLTDDNKFDIGNRVRFYPINKDKFINLGGKL